jgi:hypothetical protein
MSSTRIRVIGGNQQEYQNNDEKLLELENVFKNMDTKKGKLANNSVKSYVSKLNRLSILCKNHSFKDDKFLMSPQNVIIKLNQSNFKSKKDYISAICKYLSSKNVDKKILDTYRDAMNEYKAETENIRNKNKASEKNVEKSISMGNIEKLISKFKINDEMDLMDLLIVLFYFGNTDNFIPRNDLPHFKFVNESYIKRKNYNKIYNYITLDRNKNPLKIIMNNYKTAPTYGSQEFDISNQLKYVITMYIKKMKKQSGDYVFLMSDNMSPYTNTGFSYVIERAMKNVLGSPINVDLARQIVATNWYKNNPLASKEEKENFAKRFLHSATTNFEYMRNNLKV